MAGQSVFMIEVSKGGQGGTPLPTTSLQTKSESVISAVLAGFAGVHVLSELAAWLDRRDSYYFGMAGI